MTENWDDGLPKIKFENSDSNFTNYYKEDDLASLYGESGIDINENKDSQDDKISIDIQKPDENIVKKIVLFCSILFFIIVIPIVYHSLKEQFALINVTSQEQPLIATVKTFQYSDLYTKSEATGEITPESSVDVVARVEGYLQKTYFKEGDYVKKGQLLFKIEPDEYAIAVRASEAAVAQAQAVYTNALQELERGKELVKENFISRSDFDQMVASAASSKASLDEVKQTLARAKLNLNYTNIYSPLTGKAGTISLSDGNFVSIASGPLVNVAKTTPILIDFSMKSSDVIKMKQGNGGKLDLANAKVELILSNDSKYPTIGKIVFSNNYISSEAASLALKARFENSNNLLIPGDFVKVIVTSATPIKRILIPQSVVRGDALNGYYVWCVKENKTVKKMIEVSGSQDNQWIVETGLTADDLVVINSNTYIEVENTPVKELKHSVN